jgi:hypothetical protein
MVGMNAAFCKINIRVKRKGSAPRQRAEKNDLLRAEFGF